MVIFVDVNQKWFLIFKGHGFQSLVKINFLEVNLKFRLLANSSVHVLHELVSSSRLEAHYNG